MRCRSYFTGGAAIAAALVAVSCGAGGDPPTRTCVPVIWAREASPEASLEVVGSWNDWALPGTPMLRYQEGWRFANVPAPPGEHGYLVLDRGRRILDRHNPLTTFRGEQEVSLLVVPDCSVPELRVDELEAGENGQATLRASFLRVPGGAGLEPASIQVKEGAALVSSSPEVNDESGEITLLLSGLSEGKHTLTLIAKDEEGRQAEATAVVWIRPASTMANSWDGGLLYHIMIDRYRGDGGAPLAPPATPGSRAGGTLDGIRAEIERGTFEAMGVSALWLSPVYTNPVEARMGRDGHSYESYHGYWPLESRGVEPRIGGEAALRAMIDAAHRHGLRVIFDLVPNHVYEKNERYLAHQGDGFFADGASKCVCGTTGCGWGDHIQTCWFTDYLPDVRWQNPEAMQLGVEDARYWIRAFNADGVRIDAVPMMPRATTRRIISALRADVSPRDATFAIGEIYTGPGLFGIDEIRYYLGPDGLDSAFDFPLMWAIRDALATERSGLGSLEKTLLDTEARLVGSGAVLGRIIDNHDTSRFITEASHGAFADPYANPAPEPVGTLPYARQKMALTLILTLPGLPVLYYGDEVGLAGGGDPDSRRVMPAIESLSPEAASVLDTTQRLGRLRRCSKALQKGARVVLDATSDTYAYLRDAGDDAPVLVFLSRAKSPVSIPVSDGVVAAGAYVDVMTGESFSLGGNAVIPLEPSSFRVITPADNPCISLNR